MISLSKEPMQREVEVVHLLTEEETIAQMTKAQAEITVEVQPTAALPVVVTEDLETQLEKAREETDKVFTAFTWAVSVIFLLVFVFTCILGNLIGGHELAFGISKIASAVLLCSSVMTAVVHTLHIPPLF